MALNQQRRWLIAYDIRDPRRLARVHRLLIGVAVPVQYSVFAAAGSPRAMRGLAAALGQRIDPSVDDVRFYPVPDQAQTYTIGAAMLPEQAFLLDDRTDLNALLGRAAGARPVAHGASAVAPRAAPASTVAGTGGSNGFSPPDSESQP